MKKKRRLKRGFRIAILATGAITLCLLIVFVFDNFILNNSAFFGVKSIHRDAKSYKTKSCLAFYPKTSNGKKVASDLCNSKKNNDINDPIIYDYALLEYGDYYLVEYGNGIHYYIDHDNNPLVINELNDDAKKIVSDYLRYDMKKDEIDEAYTVDFINNTKPEDIDLSTCKYTVDGDNLLIFLPSFDYTVSIPLKYLQSYGNFNLGFDVEYVKPKYISNKRKIVAFTFDDGPNETTTKQIVECLNKYDASATFFVQGNNLYKDTVEIIKQSIANGNQYGSHTQSHPYLTKLTKEEIIKEIIGPANDLYYGYSEGTKYDFDALSYTMTIYRPPYGEHNSSIDDASPLKAILWDCDSNDWNYKDKDRIKESIYRFESKNRDELDECIVLLHDVFQETADAVDELVPELIDKGYQFITIDDLLNILSISPEKKYYPW